MDVTELLSLHSNWHHLSLILMRSTSATRAFPSTGLWSQDEKGASKKLWALTSVGPGMSHWKLPLHESLYFVFLRVMPIGLIWCLRRGWAYFSRARPFKGFLGAWTERRERLGWDACWVGGFSWAMNLRCLKIISWKTYLWTILCQSGGGFRFILKTCSCQM